MLNGYPLYPLSNDPASERDVGGLGVGCCTEEEAMGLDMDVVRAVDGVEGCVQPECRRLWFEAVCEPSGGGYCCEDAFNGCHHARSDW